MAVTYTGFNRLCDVIFFVLLCAVFFLSIKVMEKLEGIETRKDKKRYYRNQLKNRRY